MEIVAGPRAIADAATAGREPLNRGHLFAPDCYFKRTFPASPPLHPSSDTWRRNLCTQLGLDHETPLTQSAPNARPGASHGLCWLRPDGPPIYVVPPGQPYRPIALRGAHSPYSYPWVQLLERRLAAIGGVPLPLDATHGGHGDNYTYAYQPSTDRLWQLYRASDTDGDGIIDSALAGTLIENASKHPATSRDWYVNGIQVEHRLWGATATKIEPAAGFPTQEEVAAAQAAGTGLDHALVMVVGHAQSSPTPYLWPATSGDGDQASASVIPEGARIQLQPGDYSYLQANCPEFMWAQRTAETHGIIVFDKTGSGCELLLRGGDSWADLLPLYLTQGDAGYRYARALRWHTARVVASSFSA